MKLLKIKSIKILEKKRKVFDIHHNLNYKYFFDKHPNIIVKNSIILSNCSSHAGGILVAENLNKLIPLISNGGVIQSPWSEGQNVRHLEPMGFIKFDLLGLSSLKMVGETIRRILKKSLKKENISFEEIKEFYNKNLHPDAIDFNDKNIYENIFHKGKFVGIFQFTEEGAQSFCKEAKPLNINELSNITAIYRPGPLSANVDKQYLQAKGNPNNIKYVHSIMKEETQETYGFLVYQEQIASIAHRLGKDINLSEGNLLRKVLTKKGTGKEEEVKNKLYTKFINGCLEKNISELDADRIWKTFVFFSGYGFNKCLSENTLVETLTGYKKISEVQVGEKVNSKNGFVLVKDVIKQGKKKVMEIKTFNGYTLTCTLDHKIETLKGMMTLKKILSKGEKILMKHHAEKIKDAIFHREFQETYDLEVESEDHTFYANDISVSNSHSCSYSILSYQCAWLWYYYPIEWVCSYLDKESELNKDIAIANVQKNGFTIKNCDINKSNLNWEADDQDEFSVIQPLTAIKGIGLESAKEIIKHRPYSKIEDLLFNEDMIYRKVNKKIISALVKCGALNNLMDERFENLNHFWLSVAEDRPKTLSELRRNIEEHKGMHDFEKSEKVSFISELTGMYPYYLVLSNYILNKFKEIDIKPISQYSAYDLISWFILKDVKKLKTKTGKDYWILDVIDNTGYGTNLKCWDVKQNSVLFKNGLYMAKIKKDQWGLSTTISNIKKLS
ncbi:hypothetical protein M0R19_03985 [Candidatus Pacearchaeota archaeon]|nr:hypothetical protein [Candidatus Pacearchaeota archaeon]